MLLERREELIHHLRWCDVIVGANCEAAEPREVVVLNRPYATFKVCRLSAVQYHHRERKMTIAETKTKADPPVDGVVEALVYCGGGEPFSGADLHNSGHLDRTVIAES